MKLNRLFFIFTSLIMYNICAEGANKKDEKEYVFISLFCQYSADRHFSEVDFGSPDVETEYNKKTKNLEVVFYTKEECVNKLRKELLGNVTAVSEYHNDNYYTYIGGGLYRLEIGYYRYACAKYDDIKDTFPKGRQDILDYDKFYSRYNKKVPSKVDENNLQIFNNIFPLDKDEKESIEFTKRFDEEMREKIKIEIKKSKEKQRRERIEEQRKKNNSSTSNY